MQRRQSVEIARFSQVGLAYLPPKNHQDQPARVVFNHLDYVFYAGTFTFVTGVSGSGKTSLLRMLYKDLTASLGDIFVFGKHQDFLSQDELSLTRQRMGIIFQDLRLFPHLNVLNNVAMAMRIQGINNKKSQIYAEELLAWMDLGDHLYDYPDTLSNGQKQRVAVARATVTNPMLILADEPTANVDDNTAYKIMTLLHELNRAGSTVIMASHNRQIMQQFSHEEIYIHNGQIIVHKGKSQHVV